MHVRIIFATGVLIISIQFYRASREKSIKIQNVLNDRHKIVDRKFVISGKCSKRFRYTLKESELSRRGEV